MPSVNARNGKVLIEDRARIYPSRERYADSKRSSIRTHPRDFQTTEAAILECRLDIRADVESAVSIDRRKFHTLLFIILLIDTRRIFRYFVFAPYF